MYLEQAPEIAGCSQNGTGYFDESEMLNDLNRTFLEKKLNDLVDGTQLGLSIERQGRYNLLAEEQLETNSLQQTPV